MSRCFGDRIRRDRHSGSRHLQNLQMTIGNTSAFRDLRSRYNDVSGRFVRDVLGELAQHTDAIELDPSHDQHKQDGNRQGKLDNMRTSSR